MLIDRLKRRALMRLFWQRHDLSRQLWESEPEEEGPASFEEARLKLLAAMESAHERDQFKLALTAIEVAIEDGYQFTPVEAAQHFAEARWGALCLLLDLILRRFVRSRHSSLIWAWGKE